MKGGELLNMLDNEHVLRFGTAPTRHSFNIMITISKYKDKIYLNGHVDCANLETLWSAIPNQIFEWFIRSDRKLKWNTFINTMTSEMKIINNLKKIYGEYVLIGAGIIVNPT